MKTYSKEEIIKRLREYYKENDGILHLELYRQKKYKPSETTIRKRFGSWNEALTEAGIPINREVKKWYKKEDIIMFLKELSNDGTIMSANEYQKNYSSPSIETIISLFGSWNEALIAAEIDENRTLLEKDEIINRLKKYIKSYPTELNSDQYIQKKWKPSYHTIIRYFGSWIHALEKAGIKVEMPTYTDDEILDEINRCIEEVKPMPLTRTRYEKISNKPSTATIYRRFDSWENAIKLARKK